MFSQACFLVSDISEKDAAAFEKCTSEYADDLLQTVSLFFLTFLSFPQARRKVGARRRVGAPDNPRIRSFKGWSLVFLCSQTMVAPQ